MRGGFPGCPVVQGGFDKGPENRVGPVGPGLEFRVVLHPYKEGVILSLDGLHQPPVGGLAAEGEPSGALQQGAVVVVHLVPVAVPLGDLPLAVDGPEAAALQQATWSSLQWELAVTTAWATSSIICLLVIIPNPPYFAKMVSPLATATMAGKSLTLIS